MKVLITGGRGQLAQAFQKFLEEKGLEYKALSREELDIGNFETVLATVRSFAPQVIINCAAYNQVDKAEEDFPQAFRVNALGPYNLFLAAAEVKAFLIHFSTDYVFSGEKGDFYREEDHPEPINKYGLSKCLGEKALKEAEDCLLFRVSWLFGEGKQNFLAKVLSWARQRETLYIAYDEFSIPTYTETVARISWLAFEKGLRGLFHLASNDFCSRLEWAKFFLKVAGISRRVVPVPASYFNLPAKRPFFSALSSEKLQKELQVNLPPWQEEVQKFVKRPLQNILS